MPETIITGSRNGIKRPISVLEEEEKGDKEVVLAVVKKNGNALEHASDELKGNDEVVLTAMKNNDDAIKYATPELKGKLLALKAYLTK